MSEENPDSQPEYDPPLIPGEMYRFENPMRCTGYPVGGREIYPAKDMYFIEGIFITIWDNIIFCGRPFLDDRGLSPENSFCYFLVSISSALKAVEVIRVDADGLTT